MALRLRRGTDAQRLLITPLEGELIYTTDTNEIYVGDGVTAGGVRVTGNVPENLQDLNNVSTAIPGENDVLIWDAIAQQWGPIPLDTIAPGSTLASLSDVDLTLGSLVNGGILTYNEGAETWQPTDPQFFIPNLLERDLKGSVFSDDSSQIIDGINGDVFGTVKGDIETDNVVDIYRSSGAGIKFHLRQGTTDIPDSPNNFDRTGIQWASYNENTDTYVDHSLLYGYHQTGGGGYIALSAADANGEFFNSSLELNGVDGTITLVGPVTASSGITSDLTGSVFADDSSLVIDGVNGDVFGTVKGDIETDNVVDIYRSSGAGVKFHLRQGTTDIPDGPNNFDRTGIQWADWDEATNSYLDFALLYGYTQTDGSGYIALSATDVNREFFTSSIELDGKLGTISLIGETTISGSVSASTFAGDLIGSVFANDSTIVVDGGSGIVVGEVQGLLRPKAEVEIEKLTGDGLTFQIYSGTSEVKLEPEGFDRANIKWSSWDTDTSAYIDEVLIAGYHQSGGGGYAAISTANAAGVIDFSTALEIDGVASTLKLAGNNVIVSTTNIPTSSVGQAGDTTGMVAVDATSIYYCIADYTDGLSDIWVKQDWGTTGSW